MNCRLVTAVLLFLAHSFSYSQVKTQVPPYVLSWFQQHLEKSSKQVLQNIDSNDFFFRDSFRLVGYLKGYDISQKFKTGIIYIKNDLNGMDFPTVVKIYEDGRFETTVPMWYPKVLNMDLKDIWVTFYAEPGQVLAMVLDWQAFQKNEKDRSVFKYYGPLAEINTQLNQFPAVELDYDQLAKDVTTVTPELFKNRVLKNWDEQRSKLDAGLSGNNYPVKLKRLIKAKQDMDFTLFILSYTMHRRFEKMSDSTNNALKEPLPADFFDFLKRLDQNNNALMISTEFYYLINRLEYEEAFNAVNNFFNKFWGAPLEKERKMNRLRDSISRTIFYMEKGRIYDALKLQYALKAYRYSLQNNDSLKVQYNEELKATLENDFYKAEADFILARSKALDSGKGFNMPASYAGSVLKKIVAPYKGKTIFIDFWATTCAPCVGGIKNMKLTRQKYKNNPDFVFLFITSENESPKKDYDDFIKEQELENTVYLNIDDYRYLRELFRFNGIPRYAVVSDKGAIINDNFQVGLFEDELPRLLPKYRKDTGKMDRIK
ncbi:redoxin family protein [Niabella sp.]|uniref:TlpA family protein disulfide reductase n=1 Tax=Niabella sp. TaxID=1962976 RepID=UPI00260D7D80|nr:redoxin family protein [Niabella sp.]